MGLVLCFIYFRLRLLSLGGYLAIVEVRLQVLLESIEILYVRFCVYVIFNFVFVFVFFVFFTFEPFSRKR